MPVFLLSDVEGSTRLWDERADAMSAALARHDEIVVAAIASSGGEHKRDRGEGDSHFAVFGSPSGAVACALALQLALRSEPWPPGCEIRVRIGIHAGEVEEREEGYYGSVVNRAARLRAIAHGGQTVVSAAVALAAPPPPEASFVDHGPHRLKDLTEPERVFELAHPDLDDDFPPLLSLDAVRHNLPVQATSFVGRDDEVIAVRKALEESRVVTLVGTGGLGKTRLSLQVAAELVDDHPDGVWFVDLTPVTDPAFVAPAIAEVLHVGPDDLIGALRGRRTLLVLDNCEQIVGGVADVVAQIVRDAPDASVLATSREPLQVAGERVIRLPALSVPEEPDDPLAEIYPAVRLFVERAIAVRDDFSPDADATAAIVRICQRLDGVPLAIELAAARTNVLTPQQIDQRLDDRFRLLASGPRTADPRQRTLRDAVDWSHELLDEAERALFRRIAVFVGTFTLEAAEQVCAAPPITEHDVLDLLAALVDKSLVVADHASDGARYRMLETIAAYSRERLDEAGETVEMRDAHLHHYDTVLRAMSREAQVELDPAGKRWLDAELDNVRAAADHALATGDTAAGLRVLWHTFDAWDLNHQSEGIDRYAAMLAAHPERDLERLYGLTAVAMLGAFIGRTEEARTVVHEAIEIARERNHNERLAIALSVLAAIHRFDGDIDASQAALDEAEAISRADDNEQGLAHVLTRRGTLLFETDLNAAIAAFEEALALRRKAGLTVHMRNVLSSLANAFELSGRLSEARACTVEALDLADQTGADDYQNRVYLTITLGRIALAEGDHDAARSALENGLRVAQEGSLIADAGFAHALLGEVARDTGDLDRARLHYDRAAERFTAGGQAIGAAYIRSNIARIEMAKGNLAAARELANDALRTALDGSFDIGVVDFLELLAEIDAAEGHFDRALRAFGAAEAARETTGAQREPVDQPAYDEGVTTARTAAGATADTLWATGRNTPPTDLASEYLS